MNMDMNGDGNLNRCGCKHQNLIKNTYSVIDGKGKWRGGAFFKDEVGEIVGI